MFAHAYFTCTILGPAAVLVIFRNIHVEARVQHGRIAALGSHHPLETPKVLIQKMLVPVRLFVRPMPGCGGDTRQGQFLRPLLVAAEDSLAHVTAQTEPTNNPGKSPEKAGGRVCVCSDHRHAAHSDFMDNPQILKSILLHRYSAHSCFIACLHPRYVCRFLHLLKGKPSMVNWLTGQWLFVIK